MLKNKKVLNASLAILLALGLGGCGISQTTTNNKSSQPSSAKVVKHSNSHKATTKSSKSANNKTAAVVTNNSSSSTTNTPNTTYQPATTNASLAASQANTIQSNQAQSQQNTNQPQKQLQLGLGDVAIWTDSYGVVHHVDCDGMDRMTIPGSDQVKYQDWSGPLPSNAQIISSSHSSVQLGLGDVAVWTDEYGVVHHVDSDGMDRMTIPGSDQVKYQDWSGPLPSNITVIHEN